MNLASILNRQFAAAMWEREPHAVKVPIDHIIAWRVQARLAKQELAIALFGWLP